MAEEPVSLVLEYLEGIQKQSSDSRSGVGDLPLDVRGVKGHQAGFMQGEVAQDGRIADLATRLDRTELRLELRDR